MEEELSCLYFGMSLCVCTLKIDYYLNCYPQQLFVLKQLSMYIHTYNILLVWCKRFT